MKKDLFRFLVRAGLLLVALFSASSFVYKVIILWFLDVRMTAEVWLDVLMTDAIIGCVALGCLCIGIVTFLHLLEVIGGRRYLLVDVIKFFVIPQLSFDFLHDVAKNSKKIRREALWALRSGHLAEKDAKLMQGDLRDGELEIVALGVLCFKEEQEKERLMTQAEKEAYREERRRRRLAVPAGHNLIALFHRRRISFRDNGMNQKRHEINRLTALLKTGNLEPTRRLQLKCEIGKLGGLSFNSRKFRKAVYAIERRISRPVDVGCEIKCQPNMPVSARPNKAEILNPIKLNPETGLPTSFSWRNDSGKMVYASSFLEARNRLATRDQRRLDKQLEFLARLGPEYASLGTRRFANEVPLTPEPCFVSRGSRKFRFSWTKSGDITMHNVFKRSLRRAHYH